MFVSNHTRSPKAAVATGVFVGVAVGVLVGVAVGVFVGVAVGVFVAVAVGVFVGVGVGTVTKPASFVLLKSPGASVITPVAPVNTFASLSLASRPLPKMFGVVKAKPAGNVKLTT